MTKPTPTVDLDLTIIHDEFDGELFDGGSKPEQPLDFHPYAEDTIDSIWWTWGWKAGARKPRIESIEGLESWCPECWRLIKPAGRTASKKDVLEPIQFTDFACDRGHFQRSFTGSADEVRGRILRRISAQAVNAS